MKKAEGLDLVIEQERITLQNELKDEKDRNKKLRSEYFDLEMTLKK